MKLYYRIMLGKGSMFAEECYKNGFVGADFDMDIDLTGKLPNHWRGFNKLFVPVYLEKHPGPQKLQLG